MTGPETSLSVPQGTFELRRHPVRSRSTLRAWDAADAFLLRTLSGEPPAGSIAILNDGHGALTIPLATQRPLVVADTTMSRCSIGANAEANATMVGPVLRRVQDIPAEMVIDTLIVKIPRTLGRLEEDLHGVRPRLRAASRILAGGMVRDIHTSTLELFETIIGPTATTRAEQRARLANVEFDPNLHPGPNPWPSRWVHDRLSLVNRGGVFSARSIDIGTRFLLEHLPATSGGRVVDLGCGNGALGIAQARIDPTAAVIFADTSAAAVDSARASWAANHHERNAVFIEAHRLGGRIEPGSTDLVLNNPPFHDERAVGDATAWEMFLDAHEVLRPGGELRLVANRSLGHHARVRKIFGNCETVAANRKFVILSATR